MAYQPIENYGVIGDLNTVALVGMDGCIDFMCAPHFDSPSVFAALLDDVRGGSFQLAPRFEQVRHKQLYLPDTNVLLSRFLSDQGVAEVSDFMPIEEMGHAHNVVRRAKTIRGEVCYRMVCQPRYDYGRALLRIETGPDDREVLFHFTGTRDGQDRAFRLRAEVPLQMKDGAAIADFTLAAGQSAAFVFEEARPGEPSPCAAPDYVAHSFKQTVNFWRAFIVRSTYRGRWREIVNRSALTLKLLTSKPFGSLVAAPTFGLPEVIGGQRNWDYRFTWIRDASFTLYGLIILGYTEEAAAFMNWIEQRCAELAEGGTLQVAYGIDGRHQLTEETLPHFSGYRGSAPVRIGNGAYDQLQLDIYGELLDSVYLYDKYGSPISHDLWRNLLRLLQWVCENWRRPDQGIWEVRGGPREFLYSRLMCWVAIDRGIRLSRKRGLPAPLHKWHDVRDEIYNDIFQNFWDPRRRAFVQYRGATALDASVLLMPLVRFIGPRDPRWLSTLKAIEEDLVCDSLVRRYRLNDGPNRGPNDSADDGFTGEEGTFTMCSFWYVECLSRSGDLEKARFYFEKMLGYANHLGLYAEELGEKGEHLGNFPQAFTHLGLISAAHNLDLNLSAADHA